MHRDDDHLQNDKKNQGLINTIVNHNNKIKSIENKFNFIINNYANSSHVKEIIEREKEIEKHVMGVHWSSSIMVRISSRDVNNRTCWWCRGIQ